MKRVIAILLTVVLGVAFCSQPAMAYTAGDTIHITAGSIKDTVTGNTYTDKRTEAQKSADAQNSQLHKDANAIVKSILETMELERNPVYGETGGKWVQIFEADVDWDKVFILADKWLEISGDGYHTSDTTGRWDDSVVTTPTEAEKEVLESVIENDGFGDLDDKNNSGNHIYTSEEKQYIWQQLEDLIKKYCTSYRVRNEWIPGLYDVIDFETFPQRGDAIKYSLNTYYTEGEQVELLYVVEYSIASTTTASVRTSKVKYWPRTENTHFWEGTCESAPNDGYPRAPFQHFGGATATFTPNYAGEYRITATQIKENAYWDAITYNKCEYLILRDTGQVIWKSESIGDSINNPSPSRPMESMGLDNVRYYNHTLTETVYVTVWDELYSISDRPIGSFVPPTAWDEEDKIVRIE
jgi:hypothetical protein